MMLIKHMVFAPKINQSIRVIHPARRGRQMKTEAMIVASYESFFFDGVMRFIQQDSVHDFPYFEWVVSG